METTPKSQLLNAFLWLATIIGFMVDTVALIGIFSTFRLGDTSITGVPTVEIPKINLANIALKWRDVSLVIVIYLFFSLIAYIRIRLIYLKEVKEGGKTTKVVDSVDSPPLIIILWLNAVIFITFLWVIVFIYPSSVLWNYFYFIVVGWLFSIIFSAIAIYILEKYVSIWGAFIGIGIFLFGAVPILSYIFSLVLNSSFFSTLGILFLASIISVIYTIVATVVLVFLFISTLWLTEKFYGIK